MNNVTFNLSNIINEAWGLTKKHWLAVIGLLLVFGGLNKIINSLIDNFILTDAWIADIAANSSTMEEALINTYSHPLFIFAILILCIINLFIGAPFANMILQFTNDNLKKYSLSIFKMPIGTYFSYVSLQVVLMFIQIAIYYFFGFGGAIIGFLNGNVLIGMIPAILLGIFPVLFFSIRLTFAPYYILEHTEDGVLEAIRNSWNMTKGHFWQIVLLMLVMFIFIAIGLLCLIIGVLFAIVVVAFMSSVAYYALLNKHTANYDATTITSSDLP